jgi:hypothetical protein
MNCWTSDIGLPGRRHALEGAGTGATEELANLRKFRIMVQNPVWEHTAQSSAFLDFQIQCRTQSGEPVGLGG